MEKQTEEVLPSTLNIRPKYIGQKCPVCNGWGTVSNRKIKCHACGGVGYLKVPVEEIDRYDSRE